MKKLLCVFLIATSLFSFCSCQAVSSIFSPEESGVPNNSDEITYKEIVHEEKYIRNTDLELSAEE